VGISFSSAVQTLAFFLLAYILGDSFVLISHTRNCAGGVFRDSLRVISYIIVCVYVCLLLLLLLLLLLVVVVMVVCLHYYFTSDKPPPTQLIAVCVCLMCNFRGLISAFCFSRACPTIIAHTGSILCCVAVSCQYVTGVVGLLTIQWKGYVMFTRCAFLHCYAFTGVQILQ